MISETGDSLLGSETLAKNGCRSAKETVVVQCRNFKGPGSQSASVTESHHFFVVIAIPSHPRQHRGTQFGDLKVVAPL